METHGPAAGYLFSGLHPGLMRELFADRRHAFFAQSAPVELGPLPYDVLAEVVDARFRQHGRDPGEALGPLLDAGAGHPQRTMLLAHHLFLATRARSTAGIEEWMSVGERRASRVPGRDPRRLGHSRRTSSDGT